MNGFARNPYAVYVFCDGAMDYDSDSTGGVGFYIEFPEHVVLPPIKRSIGKYEGNTIENLELRAINEGMKELLKIHAANTEEFKKINTVIFITDRFALNDDERTNTYRIHEWRKNKWLNYEGRPIKNSAILDELDKNRKKVSQTLRCSVAIKYARRKYNKVADKLAEAGKKSAQIRKETGHKTEKIGKRIYDGEEIDYSSFSELDKLAVHIFRKEFIKDQWEIDVEICEGDQQGKKLRMFVGPSVEKILHRKHFYKIEIKKIFNHHILITEVISEVFKTELALDNEAPVLKELS